MPPSVDGTLCMWANYKVMERCLVAFFQFIDRNFVESNKLHPSILSAMSFINDFKMLYYPCYGGAIYSVYMFSLSTEIGDLISADRLVRTGGGGRGGEELVDRDLIKNVVNFFVEREGCGNKYSDNFEKAVLKSSANFYSLSATDWLSCCSSNDYALKVERCTNQEKERASQYFYQTTGEAHAGNVVIQ